MRLIVILYGIRLYLPDFSGRLEGEDRDSHLKSVVSRDSLTACKSCIHVQVTSQQMAFQQKCAYGNIFLLTNHMFYGLYHYIL